MPEPQQDRTLRLQVAGANERDVGKAVARLSEEAQRLLGVRQGDVIEICGRRMTPAVALPAFPRDEQLPLIRLDGFVRANAGLSLGEHAEVRRATVHPARRVVLAPAVPNLRLSGPGAALLRTLDQRPLAAGDVISTSVYRRTGDMEGGLFPEHVFHQFFERRAFGLHELRLVVTSTSPRGVVQVTPETEIELLPQYVEPEDSRAAEVTYDDVGGLGDAVEQVREMVELPLKHPQLFQRLGIDPPKGVLLHGPPGTGKTLLARAVANECGAQFYRIAGPELMGSPSGETGSRLQDLFQEALKHAPSIIFLDEIDTIAPRRSDSSSETERRLVAQLLTLMDGLKPRQNVVVIGATNRPEALDDALRQTGRFDREIIIGAPNHADRRQILAVHTRGMPLGDSVNLDELARVTYGFVGADLGALAREAAVETLRRQLPQFDLSKEIPPHVLENLQVTRDDFLDALKRVQPSALREIMIQVPTVSWDDIGGLEEVKRALRERIELPMAFPESFRRMGIRPAKGFLLYGPPGGGKTLLAKAVAKDAKANFIAARPYDLLSRWYGESEKQISRLFHRARQVAPTVIFIDEIDVLAPARGDALGDPAVTERVVNTLLVELDGLVHQHGIVVLGATNRPGLLDTVLLRPGRFDELVYVPVPDEPGRLRILEIHTRTMPLAADVDLASLARRTERFTGADLEDLVRRAGLTALREDLDIQEVPMRFFEAALKDSRASVTAEIEEEYRRMAERLKQESAMPRRIGFTLGEA